MSNVKIPAIHPRMAELVNRAERDCAEAFARVDAIERQNTRKVISAFQEHRVSLRHFAPTTGYGYDDIGRDTLSMLFRDVLGTEDAIVRPQISGGTHALAICLYAVLRPNDKMLAAAGRPYDTLEEIIGLTGEAGQGSLKDFGIGYDEVQLTESGKLDIPAIRNALTPETKLVLIQRSRGYAWRPSLPVAEINEAIDAIHAVRPDVCVMVDNCYGEFTDTCEPRADIMAGSLIKNPGGGIAPTGGYVAGKKIFVEKAVCRLNAPGIGGEVGSYAAGYQSFYQGLFMAPHTVAQAVRSAILAARAFELLGFEVNPAFDAPRNDIIQAIGLKTPERLIRFIQSIQMCSPVDSEALPEPWDMPGYQNPVIMAAGTFVAGASIELSADAPIRAPYAAYLQGALTYQHGRMALESALSLLENEHML